MQGTDEARTVMDQIYREHPSFWPHGLSLSQTNPRDNEELFLIREKQSSTPIGFVGWQERNEPNNKRAGLYSIGILPEYRRQGYAKEAVAWIMERKRAGVDRIKAYIVPDNEASHELAKRLGVDIVHKVASIKFEDMLKEASVGEEGASLLKRILPYIGGTAAGVGISGLENKYIGNNMSPQLKTINDVVGGTSGLAVAAALKSKNPLAAASILGLYPFKEMGLYGINAADKFREAQQDLTATNQATANTQLNTARTLGAQANSAAGKIIPWLEGGAGALGAGALAYHVFNHRKAQKPTGGGASPQGSKTINHAGKGPGAISIRVPASALPSDFIKDLLAANEAAPKTASEALLQRAKQAGLGDVWKGVTNWANSPSHWWTPDLLYGKGFNSTNPNVDWKPSGFANFAMGAGKMFGMDMASTGIDNLDMANKRTDLSGWQRAGMFGKGLAQTAGGFGQAALNLTGFGSLATRGLGWGGKALFNLGVNEAPAAFSAAEAGTAGRSGISRFLTTNMDNLASKLPGSNSPSRLGRIVNKFSVPFRGAFDTLSNERGVAQGRSSEGLWDLHNKVLGGKELSAGQNAFVDAARTGEWRGAGGVNYNTPSMFGENFERFGKSAIPGAEDYRGFKALSEVNQSSPYLGSSFIRNHPGMTSYAAQTGSLAMSGHPNFMWGFGGGPGSGVATDKYLGTGMGEMAANNMSQNEWDNGGAEEAMNTAKSWGYRE